MQHKEGKTLLLNRQTDRNLAAFLEAESTRRSDLASVRHVARRTANADVGPTRQELARSPVQSITNRITLIFSNYNWVEAQPRPALEVPLYRQTDVRRRYIECGESTKSTLHLLLEAPPAAKDLLEFFSPLTATPRLFPPSCGACSPSVRRVTACLARVHSSHPLLCTSCLSRTGAARMLTMCASPPRLAPGRGDCDATCNPRCCRSCCSCGFNDDDNRFAQDGRENPAARQQKDPHLEQAAPPYERRTPMTTEAGPPAQTSV